MGNALVITEEIDVVDETILVKVKKLLALANDQRGNESEMANALEKAHQLLSEHNLTMCQIESLQDDQHAGSDVSTTKFTDYDSARKALWRFDVWDAVARLYYCKVTRGRGWDFHLDKEYITYNLIGHEENAHVAAVVSEFVISQCHSIANAECRGFGQSFKASFLQGMAYRIMTRANTLIREAKEAKGTTGTGLITLSSLYDKSKAEIEAYIKANNLKFTTIKDSSPKCQAAVVAGLGAADKVSLSAPIAGKKHTLIGASH